MGTAHKSDLQTIATNKKAFHDYFVIESAEAGIELFGTEVKSVRQGRVNLKDAWCSVKDGEIFVNGMHVSPYEQGNIFNKDPLRTRKLLLHKKEINKLVGEISTKGMTIVPLKVYIKGSLVKVEIGLARGKKLHDKRQDIAKKDMRRANEREFKIKNI